MFRIFLLQLFLFLLPFIGYGIFIWVRHGLARAQQSYDINRIVVLALVGIGFMALGLVALAAFGQKEAGEYVPLQFRDGQLVPGGFRGDE